MSRYAIGASVLLTVVCLNAALSAGESRFAHTLSRSQYVHWIDLYDANQRRIDPTDPKAAPYSPSRTCGRCHDYEAIARGHHFNASLDSAQPGRPGEPWIWIDTRTGTQIPLSYRGWPGTYDPRKLGIKAWDFTLKFGRHFPGGGPSDSPTPPAEPAAKEATPAAAAEGASKEPAAGPPPAASGRWKLSGKLDIDCMLCHCNNHEYSMELWSKQIEDQNFAWAPTVALGLGFVDGKVSALPDTFDPAKVEENARNKLPATTYATGRVNAEKKVFFDVIRQPSDNTCYYCHSRQLVGKDAVPEWNCDDDVHLKAGLTCSDCHRNDIEHHTVRGFEGEVHPTGQSVAALSCRGCHLGDGADAGRLGAPQPLHKGLPPLHFDKLSCTACHSGPRPAAQASAVLTALAHGLGLPSHDYSENSVPGVVEPVLKRDDGKLYPYRMTWPAFWGSLDEGQLTPLAPEEVQAALRNTLRVRRGQTLKETLLDVKLTKDEKQEVLGEKRGAVTEAGLTEEEKAKLAERINKKALDEFQAKLAKALEDLKKIIKQPGAEPVYVAGGKAYRLAADGKTQVFEHEAAQPYAWKLAHDVRPARQSLGATGCFDCHKLGAPIFEGQLTAVSPILDGQPRKYAMYELAGFDKFKLDSWNQSFQGRAAFKWLGFASMGVVSLVLLWYAMRGLTSLAGACRCRKA
jgi:hypothetical protein